MTENTLAASGAAAEITAPDAAETQEVAAPDSTEAEGREADASEQKPEKTAEQKEVERLRRLLTKRDRTQGKLYQDNQSLRERLERLEAAQQSAKEPGEQTHIDPKDIDRLIDQRAEERATAKAVADRSNSVFEAGIKSFGDEFKESVASVIEEAGELIQWNGLPTPLGEAILDSDTPEKLLNFLGQNPELAESLHGLTAAKLGRRIAAIERQMDAEAESKPAKPLAPVKPAANPRPKSPDDLSDADWYAQRRRK